MSIGHSAADAQDAAHQMMSNTSIWKLGPEKGSALNVCAQVKLWDPGKPGGNVETAYVTLRDDNSFHCPLLYDKCFN